MKSEEKIDRLERLMKLFVRAGMRARREMNEKINILIDAQIRNDDRFAKSDERFAKFDERCARYDVLFEKNDQRIKELGERTDKTLEILMGLLKERQNGRAENPSQI